MGLFFWKSSTWIVENGSLDKGVSAYDGSSHFSLLI